MSTIKFIIKKRIGRPKDKNNWVERICKACGLKFMARRCYTKRGQMKYCSAKCGYQNKGERNGRWKGGRSIDNGYIKLYSPDHPFRDYANNVMEHRLVMEKHLNRLLKPKEIVHHINHIKTDNRIENLELFGNQSLHRKAHIKEKHA